MKFEWDENKNQSNFEKHGIYFEEAIEIFKNDCLTWIDDRKDYSDIREITIGEIKKNIVIVIVHTDRFGNKISSTPYRIVHRNRWRIRGGCRVQPCQMVGKVIFFVKQTIVNQSIWEYCRDGHFISRSAALQIKSIF